MDFRSGSPVVHHLAIYMERKEDDYIFEFYCYVKILSDLKKKLYCEISSWNGRRNISKAPKRMRVSLTLIYLRITYTNFSLLWD